PLFILDGRFDMVSFSDGLAVVNQNAFDIMFREAPALTERYPGWVDEIAQTLPFEGNGGQLLAEAASRDSRIAHRLRAIHERGHLKTVTMDQIREVAKREGVDLGGLAKGDKLVFDPDADRFTLLKLLNEDLYTGGLSGQRFE